MSSTVFETPPEMVPISGANPYWPYVAGARQVMYTGNLSQFVVVDGRTIKRQQSGLERELARGTFSHKFPSKAVVKAVIPRLTSTKFGDSFDINPLDLVIFEDFDTKRLDVIELTKFHVMHQHYGFQFEFDTDVYDKLIPGARIDKDVTIARSPAVTEQGDYMYGLETNVCMISDPAGTEDGVKYSRTYANRIRSDGFEMRTISCGRTHYPANIYGTENLYQPLPEIGQKIHSNGLICAQRPYSEKYDAMYMTRKQLLKPVYGLDTTVFGIPEATVVDIRVMHNDRLSNPRMPEEMSRQFRKYYEADKRFYINLIRTCLCRKGGQMSDDVELSPRLWEMLYEAIARAGESLIEEGLWPKSRSELLRIMKNYRGEVLDEWRVDIIYQYKTAIGEGPKVTDTAGGKGVGSAVVEDEDMPVDQYGNRADVVIFSNSTVNRLNNGRQHELVVGAAGRDIIKRIRRTYGLPDTGEIPTNVIKHAVCLHDNQVLSMKNFAYLMGFYKMVSPKMHGILSRPETIPQGRHLAHLIKVIEDGAQPWGLFLHIPANSGVRMDTVINEIKNGPYCPEMSVVTYRNLAGEMVTTKQPCLIGPNYYMALEKTATDWSGQSSSKLGPFGTPARLTNADKYSSPGRETVTKTAGESEERNMAAAMGGDWIAEMNDMNNNPVVHREACDVILTHPTPTNIPQLIDRKKFPLGGHRPLQYVIHNLVVSGKNISRADPEQRERDLRVPI